MASFPIGRIVFTFLLFRFPGKDNESNFFFFLFTIIAAIVLLYMEIFNIVVFLNVENNYLKNEGKDSKYNFKNKEEIDLRNSQSLNNFLDENNEK